MSGKEVDDFYMIVKKYISSHFIFDFLGWAPGLITMERN